MNWLAIELKTNLFILDNSSSLIKFLVKLYKNVRSRRCGSLLLGLRTLDPPHSPTTTWAKKFRRMCLQSHLQRSPPTPKNSYPKFRNHKATFFFFFETFKTEVISHSYTFKKTLKNLKTKPRGQGVPTNLLGVGIAWH